MEGRLRTRYLALVLQHMDAATALAAGIHALPHLSRSFAATQGAWRFFSNPRVTLPELVEPLRELGRDAVAESTSAYALLVHDWSKLDFAGHTSKTDQVQLSNAHDFGYELTTALLVDAADGSPLAPMELSVRAADGSHTTAHTKVQATVTHLDQVLPVMQASAGWELSRRLVHVIDREADSVWHMRAWHAAEHYFLVRSDDRRVHFEGESLLFSEIAAVLQNRGGFQSVQEVTVRGQKGQLFVAEVEVVLDQPAYRRDEQGKKYRVPGPALPLRLVVAQVRDERGQIRAEWLLLTNVPGDVVASLLAQWYYWRWLIETFHKLAKSAGLQVEEWQQETADAIAKRLVVACMACVNVWQLQRQTTPEAEACKKLLMDLSGRQTKRTRPITTSGLLAGLHALLLTLSVLERYRPEQLRTLAVAAGLPFRPSG